jgi:hypothetical protein
LRQEYAEPVLRVENAIGDFDDLIADRTTKENGRHPTGDFGRFRTVCTAEQDPVRRFHREKRAEQ